MRKLGCERSYGVTTEIFRIASFAKFFGKFGRPLSHY
jgi:hypothetical protein